MRACVPSQKRWMSRSEIAWGPSKVGPAGLAVSAAEIARAPSAAPLLLPVLIPEPCSGYGVSARQESGVLLGGTSVIRVMTCHGTLESGSRAAVGSLRADWSAEVRSMLDCRADTGLCARRR